MHLGASLILCASKAPQQKHGVFLQRVFVVIWERVRHKWDSDPEVRFI